MKSSGLGERMSRVSKTLCIAGLYWNMWVAAAGALAMAGMSASRGGKGWEALAWLGFGIAFVVAAVVHVVREVRDPYGVTFCGDRLRLEFVSGRIEELPLEAIRSVSRCNGWRSAERHYPMYYLVELAGTLIQTVAFRVGRADSETRRLLDERCQVRLSS